MHAPTKHTFQLDKRLGIPLPVLEKNWVDYSLEEQEEILLQWEGIRGDIPAQIMRFEKIIEEKQTALGLEEDMEKTCQINDEISDYASRINDLNIWLGIQEETRTRKHT